MKHLFTVGALKTIFERAAIQGFRVFTILNTILLYNIGTAVGTDWTPYYPWIILIFIGTIIYLIFDVFILIPQELKFSTEMNPMMKEMFDDIKKIKEMIKC